MFTVFNLAQQSNSNSFKITGEFCVENDNSENKCRGDKCCDRTELPQSLSFRISPNTSTSFGIRAQAGQNHVLLGYHDSLMINVNGFQASGTDDLTDLTFNEQALRVVRFIVTSELWYL